MRPATCPDAPARPDMASFGGFVLAIGQRRLTRNGIAVSIGGRALDMLICLVERAGQTVSKAELSEAAWPGRVVEEGSLRFHIVALRRVLDAGTAGTSCLTTVSGRGYCFTGKVVWSTMGVVLPRLTCPRLPCPRLPLSHNTIGIEDRLAEAELALRAGGLLTLVGPAGIGKTVLALRLGHHVANAFPDGVALVDLAMVRDPALVPGAVAAAAGGRLMDGSVEELLGLLAGRRILLILDGCEPVIDSVAELAERLLRHELNMTILATSRESLRVEGEVIFRLFPLACPPLDADLDMARLMLYPAARLFVEKVQSACLHYRLTAQDVPLVIDICRKLDGIPLALDLAAGCVASHGIGPTAQLLDEHVHLSWKGRRTAPPRHQTLRAALDWSYDLLSPAERKVFRRVSVFFGEFTAEAAWMVAGDDLIPGEVAQILFDLAAKSMINMEGGGIGPCRYRLFETMVAYGFDQLWASGEADATLARLAGWTMTQASSGEKSADIGTVADRKAVGWPDAVALKQIQMRQETRRLTMAATAA